MERGPDLKKPHAPESPPDAGAAVEEQPQADITATTKRDSCLAGIGMPIVFPRLKKHDLDSNGSLDGCEMLEMPDRDIGSVFQFGTEESMSADYDKVSIEEAAKLFIKLPMDKIAHIIKYDASSESLSSLFNILCEREIDKAVDVIREIYKSEGANSIGKGLFPSSLLVLRCVSSGNQGKLEDKLRETAPDVLSGILESEQAFDSMRSVQVFDASRLGLIPARRKSPVEPEPAINAAAAAEVDQVYASIRTDNHSITEKLNPRMREIYANALDRGIEISVIKRAMRTSVEQHGALLGTPKVENSALVAASVEVVKSLNIKLQGWGVTPISFPISFIDKEQIDREHVSRAHADERMRGTSLPFHGHIVMSVSSDTQMTAVEKSVLIHEQLHAQSHGFTARSLNEGFTAYFTTLALMEEEGGTDFSPDAVGKFYTIRIEREVQNGQTANYAVQLFAAASLVEMVGVETARQAYFDGDRADMILLLGAKKWKELKLIADEGIDDISQLEKFLNTAWR